MTTQKTKENIINKLSEFTANQIAAGEVVQRPASVVKELMENAIDAGATMVVLGVRDGGRSVIQVIDDGVGMSYDDALTAFERHATSKIKESADLSHLNTFGFRGEALPSIASVAEVEIKTMRHTDDIGTQVLITGGELVDHSPVQTSIGTQFSVKNLFYNIPARRKFMKSAEVETRHIIAEFKRLALFHNQVSFVMHNNDKCLYSLPVTNLRNRVTDVIGSKIDKEVIEINTDTPIIDIKGYVGRPEKARRSPEQYLFINGRFFKSNVLNKAIIAAYDNLLTTQNYTPHYFIYLSCDPSLIDVNVHPSKIEVKFEHEEEIAQLLKASIRASLGKNGIMPMIDFDGAYNIDLPITGNAGVLSKQDANVVYNSNDSSFSFTDALFGGDGTFSDTGKDLDEEDMAKEVQKTIGDNFARTNSIQHSTKLSDYNIPPANSLPKGQIESSFTFSSSTPEPKVYESNLADFMTDSSLSEPSGKVYESSATFFTSNTSQLSSPLSSSSTNSSEEKVIHSFEDFLNENSDSETESAYFDESSPLQQGAEAEDNNLFPLATNPAPIGETSMLDGKYILTSISSDVYIIDIQRAMNRIMYDRYKSSITATDNQGSQRILFPPTIALQPSDRMLIDDGRNDLRSMGFVIEDSEQSGAIDLLGIPVDINESDHYQLFEDILDSLKTDDNMGYNEDKRERLINRVAQIATNKKLSPTNKDDMKQIVNTLRQSSNYSYSPQGKPIIAKISLADIKKLLN